MSVSRLCVLVAISCLLASCAKAPLPKEQSQKDKPPTRTVKADRGTSFASEQAAPPSYKLARQLDMSSSRQVRTWDDFSFSIKGRQALFVYSVDPKRTVDFTLQIRVFNTHKLVSALVIKPGQPSKGWWYFGEPGRYYWQVSPTDTMPFSINLYGVERYDEQLFASIRPPRISKSDYARESEVQAVYAEAQKQNEAQRAKERQAQIDGNYGQPMLGIACRNCRAVQTSWNKQGRCSNCGKFTFERR